MINNQSDKPEKLKPQDSGEKEVKHPKDDSQAVVKPEDKKYEKKDAKMQSPAKQKETGEQPVTPNKNAPKEFE